MPTLVSPGVSVTVTDESFFIPASAPTVPLFFVATEDEKLQADGVTPAEATYEWDVVRTVTSLTQSTQLYGVPRFLEDAGTGEQHHGDARNEYGLFALNQFLGIGNLAYVIRANVNLNDDLDDLRTLWDVKFQESAVVMENLTNEFINEYNAANGLILGLPGFKQTVTATEFISLATEATDGAFSMYSFSTVQDDYFDDHTLPAAATSGYQQADYGGLLNNGLYVVALTEAVTSATGTGIANDGTAYTMEVHIDGNLSGSPVGVDATPITVNVLGQNVQTFGDLVNQINVDLGSEASVEIRNGNLYFWSATSGASSSVYINDIDLLAALGAGTGSPLLYRHDPANDIQAAGATGDHPTGLSNDGSPAITYTASVVIDGTAESIQIDGNTAQTFTDLVTELNADLTLGVAAISTDGNIRITSLTTGDTSTVNISDGTLFAATNWYVAMQPAIPGADTDSALPIYENGYDQPSTGSYSGLTYLADNYTAGSVVADEFTPQEASNMVVAAADQFKYTVEFLNKTALGANDAARRVAITTALQASINSNTDIRSDNFEFNLVLCPGYHEVVDEMLALVVDIQEEALVIADTPVDRDPDGIVNPATGWAVSTERLISTNCAYYYPWALASNLDGKNVVVAPSGTALRTFAYNDDVAFLWFAPAGTRRGQITGISDLGYVSGTLGGVTTFNSLALNQGERDALYQYTASGGINPMVFFPGRGFLIWGQKTSTSIASALDRVNVSRLIKYVKRSLRKNTLPFVFEPNDALTRDNLKAVVDNFLGDLIVKRGLYDFATICDESNNTPDRIDRNELYVDVALKPVKAAEFIYIPIRVVTTGAEI